ncbi:hypothetical protein FRC01_012945 [Tulasnella sp. 417]|nr:hypothetical protein FRC01_012945 [Tulasnella sp. 417]
MAFDRLTYEPSYLFGESSPWVQKDLYSSAPATPFWFSGMFHGMPSWSTTVRGADQCRYVHRLRYTWLIIGVTTAGHDIQILVPSPALFPESRYANVRCCLDGRCHCPDIEQWLLNGTDTSSDVVLVHYKDLSPFKDHRISMTAVRRDDEVGDKIIAISRVVYEKPVDSPDGGIGVLTLVALALMGCVALFLIIKARKYLPGRQPLDHQPLPQSILPTSAPAAPLVDIPMTAGREIKYQPNLPITGPATPPPY